MLLAMTVREPGALRGREREREALGRLITAVRAGRSGVLAIRGEAGIGKTALLESLRAGCESIRVLRTTGVESEAELAYAALHTLCSQLPAGTMDQLPPAQQTALQVALGNGVGSPPDPFLVGLAMLNCLSDVAERQHVVCLVDDAQWLDRASAQTIAFVARRLDADAVAVVLAIRGHAEPLADLPELLLGGLAYSDARELLESILPAPIDESVRDRFISETGGNPLALTELARWLGSGHLAGGFDVPDLPDVMDWTAQSFRRRITELPSDSRQLLLIGAAEPIGDPVLLWRAARLLEITPAAAEPVEAAGLVSFGVRVTFSHPLIRSVAYRLAEADERRRVHRALAQATDPEADPDRRAWHRPQGAVGPNEDVALELERSADRAQARGGLAAAAAIARSRPPGRSWRLGRQMTRSSCCRWSSRRTTTLLDWRE
jgi:AAA ATPase domain